MMTETIRCQEFFLTLHSHKMIRVLFDFLYDHWIQDVTFAPKVTISRMQ